MAKRRTTSPPYLASRVEGGVESNLMLVAPLSAVQEGMDHILRIKPSRRREKTDLVRDGDDCWKKAGSDG